MMRRTPSVCLRIWQSLLETRISSYPSLSASIHDYKNQCCCFSSRAFSSAATSNQEIDSTKVLYDGECRLCTVEISGLKRFTRNKKDIEFVDITSPEYDPSKFKGVTYEDAMKEMHVIDSSGQVLVQGDAIRHMYRASGLGWLAAATELPGIKPVCDRLYLRFAEYRLRKALDRCDDSDRCSIKLRHLKETLKKTES